MNLPLIAFGLPSGPDLIVIAVLVLVLFGSKKLPVFGRSLGRCLDEFRQVGDEFENELDRHWHFRSRAEPGDHRTSLKMPLILLVAAIVFLLVSLFVQSPH